MNPELYWKTAQGDWIKVENMSTRHLINTVKLINSMADRHNLFEYPECYDMMYEELNARGVDTDWELDSYYPKL